MTWIEAELSSLECFEIPIDPRSYLEVIDKKNRYGKNLRLYYKEYQNCVSNQKSNCCSRLLREANNNSEEMSCGDKKYKEFFEWLEYDDGNHEVQWLLPFRCLNLSHSVDCDPAGGGLHARATGY